MLKLIKIILALMLVLGIGSAVTYTANDFAQFVGGSSPTLKDGSYSPSSFLASSGGSLTGAVVSSSSVLLNGARSSMMVQGYNSLSSKANAIAMDVVPSGTLDSNTVARIFATGADASSYPEFRLQLQTRSGTAKNIMQVLPTGNTVFGGSSGKVGFGGRLPTTYPVEVLGDVYVTGKYISGLEQSFSSTGTGSEQTVTFNPAYTTKPLHVSIIGTDRTKPGFVLSGPYVYPDRMYLSWSVGSPYTVTVDP